MPAPIGVCIRYYQPQRTKFVRSPALAVQSTPRGPRKPTSPSIACRGLVIPELAGSLSRVSSPTADPWSSNDDAGHHFRHVDLAEALL